MNHGELAKQNFENGCNCAQSVLTAFTDLTGLTEAQSMKIASSFGGGMGRLREVCGALTGAFMVLGLLYADDHVPEHGAKSTHYERVQEFAAKFREQNGSILCRDLLAGVETVPGKVPEKRSKEYYEKRPCGELVRYAADLLDRYIEANPL